MAGPQLGWRDRYGTGSLVGSAREACGVIGVAKYQGRTPATRSRSSARCISPDLALWAWTQRSAWVCHWPEAPPGTRARRCAGAWCSRPRFARSGWTWLAVLLAIARPWRSTLERRSFFTPHSL